MSDTVIQVEGLSKHYLIRHLRKGEQQFGYVALRDVLAERVRNLFARCRSSIPHSAFRIPSSQEEFWALKDRLRILSLILPTSVSSSVRLRQVCFLTRLRPIAALLYLRESDY